MFEKGLISVIIPIYNVELFLERCIRSIMSNTYRHLEIICVDDGSRDTSGIILDKLAEEDERIVPVHQKNGGVSAARNKGLEIAKGEYIAFVDSDDYIHPGYFQSLLECMQSTGAGMAVCRADKVNEDTVIEYPDYKDIQYQMKLTANSFFKSYYARHMVWGKLYRKRDIDGHWFTPEVRYGEDTLFNLRIIHETAQPVVYETTTPLYYYLMRASSLVHTVSLETNMDFGEWYYRNRAGQRKNTASGNGCCPCRQLK